MRSLKLPLCLLQVLQRNVLLLRNSSTILQLCVDICRIKLSNITTNTQVAELERVHWAKNTIFCCNKLYLTSYKVLYNNSLRLTLITILIVITDTMNKHISVFIKYNWRWYWYFNAGYVHDDNKCHNITSHMHSPADKHYYNKFINTMLTLK